MSNPFHPDQCHAYFAARLPGYEWNGNGRPQVSTHCPFHDDGTASFSLNLDEGIWKCHAGCGEGGILDFEELFSNCSHEEAVANVNELLGTTLGSNGSKPEAVHVYKSVTGTVLFRKKRFRKTDGDKTFSYERPDGKGWVTGLNGTVKPLYRVDELVRSSYAIVVEGEKCVDRLVPLDLAQYDPLGLPVAITTNHDGAGHWRPEYAPYFIGKQVTILPDNDAPGEAHALTAARSILSVAAGVKICHLPGLPEHGDVSDWLDAGHTPEELIAQIAESPAWREGADLTTPFHGVAEILAAGTAQASWIVPFFVEQTAITSLSGKIKLGKTTLLLAACRSVLRGASFLDQPTIGGPVVMVTEQAGSSFISALQRAGIHGDENLRIMQPHDFFGMDWAAVVTSAVKECNRVGARLLVIDTINTVSGLSGDDENSAGRMMAVMRELQQASGQGFAICYTAHERKSGGDVSDCARGSSAVGGVADILMSLTKPAGNHRSESIRKISSISRFSETPAELVIDWTPDGEYIVVGNSDAVTRDRATQAVRMALPLFADSAKTLKRLIAESGESRTTVQRALRELRAVLVESEKQSEPIRYWLRGGSQ